MLRESDGNPARRSQLPRQSLGGNVDRYKITPLDEVADGLDELKTVVEEIEENPPQGASAERLDVLKQKIDQARDVSDELQDETD